MFRLTREVRFAINPLGTPQFEVHNSFGGFPGLAGLNRHYALQCTLVGDLEADSQYLCNIKEIDQVVRQRAIGIIAEALDGAAASLPLDLFLALKDSWPGTGLAGIRLLLTPTLSVSCLAEEIPMVRLSQKFEFSASHRLHNPSLSEDGNRRIFGKCNNPLGHGHNYEVQVTLRGEPDANGLLTGLPELERIVDETVISRFDHKNLNVEVVEFASTNPTVENIAKAVFKLLKPKFSASSTLAGVTVWETPKTWCEYSE